MHKFWQLKQFFYHNCSRNRDAKSQKIYQRKIMTRWLGKCIKNESTGIFQMGTCQYNLVSDIYSHCQYICTTCEYNICSIRITKYLEANPTKELDKLRSEWHHFLIGSYIKDLNTEWKYWHLLQQMDSHCHLLQKHRQV